MDLAVSGDLLKITSVRVDRATHPGTEGGEDLWAASATRSRVVPAREHLWGGLCHPPGCVRARPLLGRTVPPTLVMITRGRCQGGPCHPPWERPQKNMKEKEGYKKT